MKVASLCPATNINKGEKMNWLKGKKSYILGGLMIVHGLISFLVGDSTFQEFFQGSKEMYEIMSGGGIMTLKAAAAKGPGQ